MTMIHTRMAEVSDPVLEGLLQEIGFVCGLRPADHGRSGLFHFIELCFAHHDLKRAAKFHPAPGLLNGKASSVRGSRAEAFLREYCALRGVLFEGYEERKLHLLISTLAPKPVKSFKKRSQATPTMHQRSMNVILQRRANRDL